MKNIIISQDTPVIRMPKSNPGDETVIIQENTGTMSRLAVHEDGTLSFEQNIGAEELEKAMFISLLKHAPKFKATNSKKTAFDVKTTDRELLNIFGDGGSLTFEGTCSFTIRNTEAVNIETDEKTQDRPAKAPRKTKNEQDATGIANKPSEKNTAPEPAAETPTMTTQIEQAATAADTNNTDGVTDKTPKTVDTAAQPQLPTNPLFANTNQQVTAANKSKQPAMPTAEAGNPLTKSQKEILIADTVGTADKNVVTEIIRCINMSSDSNEQLKFQLKYNLATHGYQATECDEIAKKIAPIYKQIKG